MLAQPYPHQSARAESCFRQVRSAPVLAVRTTNPAVLLFRKKST